MGVIALPRPLAAWAGPLSLFPPEIALALEPLVQRLHALLGEGKGAAGSAGEPDGYDGIARRGPYERLLGSEWALLSEVPEEFLRRAAAGEHGFLRLAHRPPSGGRRAVVLFDAGPDQLGGPRIAHLAALVVLAARLERQRGTLSWGVLQDESGTLENELSPRSVRALLDARSARAAARGDVARWLADRGVAGASEVWIAGAEDLRAEAERRAASMLIVADALEPGARRLAVRALPAGAAGAGPRAAEALLELPEEPDCIRLLRDPFGAATAPRSAGPAAADPSAGLVFSSNGRRLYARSAAGKLLTFVVPNSPYASVPPPAAFEPPEGQVPVAAGIEPAKGRTVVVCVGRGAYFTHRLTMSRRAAFESREHRFEGRPDLATEMPAPPGRLMPLAVSDKGAVCFCVPPGRVAVVLEDGTASARGAVEARAPYGGPQWLAEGGGAESTGPFGSTVIGALGPPSSTAGRAMVLLDVERRRIDRFWNGERKRLLSTTAPIAAARLEPDLGLVGFVTETGELGVYSFRKDTIALHSYPEGEAR